LGLRENLVGWVGKRLYSAIYCGFLFKTVVFFAIRTRLRVYFDYFGNFACCSSETFIDYENSFDFLNG
jgi:hypothetical protein